VGVPNENDYPCPLSSLLSPQSGDVLPSPMASIPSKEVDEHKESASIHDFTSPRDAPTPSSYVSKPLPLFPN